MKHLYKYLSIIFFLFSLTAQAQVEICGDGIDNDGNGFADCLDLEAKCYLTDPNCGIESDCGNGVDDDGDGFVDYYDGDCLDDPDNPNDYITIKPDCEAQPVGNVFEIEPAWDSDILTSAALGMPSVADLDQDGYPEVISMNSETGWLYILDGRTGVTLNQIRIKNGSVFAYPAVGDVDGDGFGEIFTIDLNGVIRVYEHDLTLKWTQTSSFTGFGRPLALADFNHDGSAELYTVNEVWDAETGTLLIKGSHGSSMYPSANNWYTELNAVPVAVEIIPSSPGLELVVGHIIYTVNITNTGGTAGNSLTEAMNMDDAGNKPAGYAGYHPADADWGNQNYSQTAVVDYNLDGSLDVIMGGANGGHDGPTTAFFWDIANDVVKTYTVLRPGNTIPGLIKGTFSDVNGNNCDNGDLCYWERGLGNINIANIDDDAEPEATFMSGSSLFALDNDFTEKWANHDDFWESSSGVTGTTVFDFDGDGSSEIVYRDEINLYIVDGTTGVPLNLLNGTYCSSQTQGDYPIVADVDGDGETEIIVSCGEEENTFGSSPATSGTRTNGFIRAYKAAGGNYWVPSRALWNQTNYFNVNINDNLSIPKVQQAHHLNFSQICNDPSAPASFSLNKFLNQSPRISFCGQLTFPSPKLDFADDGVVITPPVCPDNQFEVRVVFENNGSQAVNKPVPITFYGANPTSSYSNTDDSPYLETVDINVPGGIAIGQKVDTTIMVNALRGAFTLFVSLNDIGQIDSTGAPMTNEDFYPLTKLNGSIRECDDTPTIVSKAVNPLPFPIKAVKVRDNRTCPGEVNFNNGELQVLAPDDTPFPASSYAFTWTDIHTGQLVGSDAILSGLDSGTYRIVVENTDYGCFGNADTIRVEKFEGWPDTQVITLEELQPVSSCTPGTADGEARVLIDNNPVDETQYDVEWAVEEQDNIDLAIGDTATNLKPLLYKVTVTNKLTGCSDSETIDMTLDLPEMDQPEATDNTNCLTPNGSVAAKLPSGSTASLSDYEYMLIQLSPAQDTIFNGSKHVFEDLPKGIYELRAYNPGTDCGRYSNGIEVEIDDDLPINSITADVASVQSACNAPYNGQLTITSDTIEYDFTWYQGTITSGPSAVIVSNTALTPDTLSTTLTDQYTVVATHMITRCTASLVVTLDEKIILPIAEISNFTVTDQTKCSPDGSIQSVVANPEAGATYVYTLLQGSTELASNNSGLFENLEAGQYVISIENEATGCVSIPSDKIDVGENIPAFPAYNITDLAVTNCNSSKPDGSLTLDFSGGNDDYDFYWYVGVDTSTPVSPQPSVANSLTNIAAGDYKVRVTSDSTGCETLISLVLNDNSADYMDQISAQVLQDQQYCVGYSGKARANLVAPSGAAADTSLYTFYWYAGSKNNVENNSAPLISGENNATIKGLDAGTYSVRAVKNDGSGCHALDTAQVIINDVSVSQYTDIAVTIVEQSSCNSNDPNGSLIGNVGGNNSDYTFTWKWVDGGIDKDINSTNISTANISDNEITGLPVGTYKLIVENNITGCSGFQVVTLNDNIIQGNEIRLTLASTEVSSCTSPDGVAEVTNIDLSEDNGATFTIADDLSNYTFEWYEGNSTSASDLIDPATHPSANTARLQNVEPGVYTVIANNIDSECASVSYSVEVESETQNNISFTVSFDEQDDCINPNGGIHITAVTGGSGTYTYQWHTGSTDEYPLVGETNASLENVRTSKYMLRITDQVSGCYKDEVISLPAAAGITPVPPANLSQVEHVNACVPKNTGRLVGEVDPTLLSDPSSLFFGYNDSDFYYYWFEGENPKYINPSADPIDDISNFDIITSQPTTGNNQAEITGLEPGFYTVIVVDASSGSPDGCRSEPTTFEVKSISQAPVATVITTPDIYCVGDNGTADITIEKKNGDSTPYDGYSIVSSTLDGNPYTAPALSITQNDDFGTDQTSILLTDLSLGSYSFTFRDNETKCDTTITFDIGINTDIPILSNDNVQLVSHKTSCNPNNGEAEVIISASGDGITNLSEYTFYWHETEATTNSDITDAAVYVQTGEQATGLDVGVYYVYAINNTTGCASSFQTIEIKDKVPATVIELVSNTPDRNCDTATPGSGLISIRIYDEDNSGNVTYPAGGYDVLWEDENGVDVTAQAAPNDGDTNGGTQPATTTLANLSAGEYTVSVINPETQCKTVLARYTIDSDPYLPEFTAVSANITHSTTCDGNGEVVISEIRENGNYITDFTNYSFEWYESDGTTPITDDLGSTIIGNTITGLSADTLYVYVTNTTTGNCTSNSLQVIIENESTPPLIYQEELLPFISCTGVNEGVIEVAGEESDPANVPALGYRYEWAMADGSPMPTDAVYNADSSRVSNLQNGSYQVLMTNKSTGCQISETYDIRLRQVTPILLMAKLADQTFCYGNGEAEVSEVRMMGSTLNPNDFRFIWYESDLTTVIATPTYGLNVNAMHADSLVAGIYYVVAENIHTGCTALPVQFEIEDNSEPIIVSLDDISDPIIACDPSNFPEGEIEIEVRNSTSVITSWYSGNSVTNPADSIPGFNNSLEIENLVPGQYTVWVMDTLTGCSTTRTYTIEGIEVPLMVNTSSTNYSSCIQPDGTIAANINGGSGDYIINWFSGTGNDLQPIASANNSTLIEGLTNGIYTVVVQDRREPYCQESRAEIVVEDSRGEEIMVVVNNDFQMTNCDDNLPNGQLSAVVNGELSRYNFFWYNGTDTNTKPIATGPVIAELASGQFTLLARDKVTGCISMPFTGEVIAVTDTTIIPAPVVSSTPVTRCDSPNGTATAILDSTFVEPDVDYRYSWYDTEGELVFSSIRSNTANFLSAGEYTVIVSNVLTGCSAETATVSVGEDIYVPEFEVISTPSICSQPNGTIRLEFVEPIKIVDVEWITPDGYESGFILNNQPAGFYEVTITDDKGCKHTKTAEIKSQIHVYNGVSPNGDGKNDKFMISCIEQYHENVVRIYNRAGAIVYEDFKYDNESVYFEGYGNRGLYIGGDELPEGTYYYIVDKKNGDEPVSGYLELLR
ncbi:gliding motility-associated-like protein [Catalinimonas alkaloidigena]|uniref:T9SS type B sorting domain-containing protein n=1 Tax=Catalinimonas alkaloidigena TaxID=1075417 RepID=UPI0024073F3F|nr:gliding motility-associated C-terminal domain-containing protein [Catalinimonas alkaloidigena]MDF9797606.1 gliding motility-associated-like protein [Catalinimonas alkaloidigena]